MPQLLVLAVLCGVSPFATDMYLPGFTRLRTDLHTSAAAVQLTLTSFLIGFALGQLIIGSLSDRYGRRAPLLVCAVVFAVAGAACADAPTIWLLVIARFVQGFMGSSGLVIARAVVADRTHGPAAVRSLSIMSTISSLAPVIAPLAGGALLSPLGWRGIFWVLSALGAVLVPAVYIALPESLPHGLRSTGGAPVLMHSGKQLMKDRQYIGNLAAVACGFGVMMAYVSASAFVVQSVYGLTPGEYSLDFAINASMLTVGLAINSALVGRCGAVRMRNAAQAALLVVIGIFAGLTLSGHQPVLVMLALLALTVGCLAVNSNNSVALAMARSRRFAGTGSALIGAVQFGFGSLVTPLVGLAGPGTAVPMAVVMSGCICLAVVAARWSDSGPSAGRLP